VALHLGGLARRRDPGTSIDRQHDDVRDTLKLSKEFVVHSLRHTMLMRLGEVGADAAKFEQAAAEGKAEAVGRSDVPKESPKMGNARAAKSSQVVEIKRAGP